MNPRVSDIREDDTVLSFQLQGVNVSVANAVRRTILSDIPTVVFRTTPYEENKAVFITNTTRQNNEILKQRLGCVPIHITEMDTPLADYIVEVEVENLTDTIQYVTTADFRVKNVKTGKYLSAQANAQIFPPNDAGFYIDFARLRPKISEEIPGEKLHFTCELSIGTAKENAMYNCVSTCSYGFTPDADAIETELASLEKKLESNGASKEVIQHEVENFRLLEAQRIVRQDSFDFVVESVGVFQNRDIVKKACAILVQKFQEMDARIDTDEQRIEPAVSTMRFCYDVILENEDYTVGKVIEFLMYSKFFEDLEVLTFCGFKKMHPHDADSIVRVAYKESTDVAVVKQHLKACTTDAIAIYNKVASRF
jgi:DNA-directed RNA polymerase alpha subunit/DNA-directed RNA polymerase subunit L